MHPRTSLLLVAACALAACSGGKRVNDDNAPTLKSLAGRTVPVDAGRGIERSEEKAIAAYRAFLDIAPRAPQRAEAMRRLGDLEMDAADHRGANDYREAVARYQEVLKNYPNDPNNDRVLYQLARAQEMGGDLDTALKTLDRLVQTYPATAHAAEAHFRRGELLFTTRAYAQAEKAYATVLAAGAGAYQERSLYMQGWSVFKQGRLEESLHSFFGVLDAKLAGLGDDAELETLSRGDRELVEDTFRVASVALTNLEGAASIPAYVATDARRSYEFRIYQQLGEFYLKQERVKDAADTFGLFARRQPLHAQAPQLQARVIEIYQRSGFAGLALEAKKEYVARYGHDSEFRRANSQGWERAQPLVKTHLAELTQHHHAAAQKSRRTEDYAEAVRWYRAFLASFGKDPEAPAQNFLLAELLFEDGQYAAASAEYEKTAYDHPAHARSAEAGYAALLAHAERDKRAATPEKAAVQRAGIDSALKFAAAFPADTRAGAVLANAAERLYALNDAERAAAVAQQVLDLKPAAPPAERRIAWTVLAHAAFERGAFDAAERGYTEVAALTPDNDAGRAELMERLAASVYKQGEKARASEQPREAVAHFERIATLAPNSAVRATAQYDAAAALIGLKDWAGATRLLEDFRRRYPQHPLQGEVGGKLAAAYLEQGQWAQAAPEFERLAAASKDPQVARDALWQAAELHDKGNARAAAARAYERYVQLYPQPLAPAIEARWRLARQAKADGQPARELALMKEVYAADQSGGAARTDRTRYLGATAALALAEPVVAEYRKVALVEPLARNLKLKKERMEAALKAYAVATDHGVADVSTAATFHVGALYQDFGKALMGSQRPKGLKKAELEQYNVMLEEQAFPFEEKAAELHEVNARRAGTGLYDEWVQKSYAALRELRPVRYGKTERVEKSAAAPAEAANREGMTLRGQGRFAQARESYEKAIELDPAYAAPVLNLGILHDLYLQDGARALALYEQYLKLAPNGDAQVTKWIAELKNRKPAAVAVNRKDAP